MQDVYCQRAISLQIAVKTLNLGLVQVMVTLLTSFTTRLNQ